MLETSKYLLKFCFLPAERSGGFSMQGGLVFSVFKYFFCKPCRIVAMDCLGFINIIVGSTVLITGSMWCKAGVLGNSRYLGWMLQTSFLAGWFCNLSAKTIYSVWYIYTWNLTEHFFSVRRENLLQRARDTGQTLLISQAVSLSDELDEFAGNSSLTRNSYC